MATKKQGSQPHPSTSSSAAPARQVVEKMTAGELPLAVGKLFELNNYTVEYGKKVHGAEVDLVARAKGNPFAPVVYIEATVQYVDNTKYGKDMTKFSLLRTKDPACSCICLSSAGFTLDVKERAAETNIQTLTYVELFTKFEKFDPYVELITESSVINQLMNSYEEPFFKDRRGEEIATTWLNEWKESRQPSMNWLVVLGEYGTGKTALTLRLQSEWIRQYRENPSHPIPLRIELRSFTKQFDARSLIHHFLDKNELGHIPIDFVFHLIRKCRIVLILDGYDEMAQFLNARERRSCLAALAELSADGAMGLLTSRPNYFTEAEELNVFEALYSSIEQNKYHLSHMDRLFIAEEQSIDSLLEGYLINRNERYLRDLSPEQTKSLVKRKLSQDAAGQEIVLTLLDKVFRDEGDGRKQALSGKPVIISYLLELIDELRSTPSEKDPGDLTEWQIYKLIVDRLMIRDLQRSPALAPEARRKALQKLAIILSAKSVVTATEEVFNSIIDEVFKGELRRLAPEERRARRVELFQDLRSSATLTRSEGGGPQGWVFSHNSLREYLVTEAAVASVVNKSPMDMSMPISSAMRSFVAALSPENANAYIVGLQSIWPERAEKNIGGFLTLSHELLRINENGFLANLRHLTGTHVGAPIDLSRIVLKDLDLSANILGRKRVALHAESSTLVDVNLKDLQLQESDLSNAILDHVLLSGCDLSRSSFRSSFIHECDLTNTVVQDTDFIGLDIDSNFVVQSHMGEVQVITGKVAIGYLRFHGAKTDDMDSYFELMHHPKFPIIIKICQNISEQKNSQLRGLTQRGVAQMDPPFARSFVDLLENNSLVSINQNNLVSATPEGRRQLPALVDHETMPPVIEAFLRQWR
jgi:hypothetical protein